MDLVQVEEMRLLEVRAQQEYGLTPRVLMEAAGIAAFNLIQRILGTARGKRILVCIGKGNNGGDGLVLARHLANAGAQVLVALAGERESLRGPAREALGPVAQMAADCEEATGLSQLWFYECAEVDWQRKLRLLPPWDLVVDALMGTGLKGALKGVNKEMVKFINGLDCPCVALDLPSGIAANSGQITPLVEGEPGADCAVEAEYTITFGRPKIGLYCYPAPDYVGELYWDDLGIPSTLVAKSRLSCQLLVADRIRKLLPVRPNSAHKGSFGHVLAIGGSRGLSGAVALSALAALRVGAGKSTLASPVGLQPIFATKLTEVMTLSLGETAQGGIAAHGLADLDGRLEEFNALVVGPGISTQEETKKFVYGLLGRARQRLVLDADALNIIASEPERFIPLLARNGDEWPVLTPHPGEMARLLGTGTREVQRHRLDAAKEGATRYRSIIVLKGANTLIATPEGRVFVSPTGHSGMATAGTGDVLAGVIGGLLAQGASPVDAACSGAYLHGLAGELAAQDGYTAGLIAGDLLNYLPKVLTAYYDTRK